MVISAFHGTDCCMDSFGKITGTLFLTDNPGLAKMFGKNVFHINVEADKTFEIDWEGCSWGGGTGHQTVMKKNVNTGKITACVSTCSLPSCSATDLTCSLPITLPRKTASARQNMSYQTFVN